MTGFKKFDKYSRSGVLRVLSAHKKDILHLPLSDRHCHKRGNTEEEEVSFAGNTIPSCAGHLLTFAFSPSDFDSKLLCSDQLLNITCVLVHVPWVPLFNILVICFFHERNLTSARILNITTVAVYVNLTSWRASNKTQLQKKESWCSVYIRWCKKNSAAASLPYKGVKPSQSATIIGR